MTKIRDIFIHTATVVAVLAGAGSATALEREGRLDVVDCYSGEIQLIQHTEETFWLTWQQTGTRRSVEANGPFDGMTAQCVGFLWSTQGEMNGHSACEYVDKDSNKLFVKAQRIGDNASWEFAGGTGEYTGITGSGVFTDFSYFPRLTPTTYQFCPTSNGSYKLPD